LKGRQRCWTCKGEGVVGSMRGARTRLCPDCNGKPKRGYQRILSEPEQVIAEQEATAEGVFV
jgi:DnaJ-class molecular chaperone